MRSLHVLASDHHPSMPNLEVLVVVFIVSGIRLTFDFDFTIVDHDLFVPGGHDRAADRHLLDLNTHCTSISKELNSKETGELLVGDWLCFPVCCWKYKYSLLCTGAILGVSIALIRYNHLTLLAPIYPITTARKGKPWIFGSGLPFISQARSTSLALTFDHGTETT